MVAMTELEKFVSKIETEVDYVVYSRFTSYDLWQPQMSMGSLKKAKDFCDNKIRNRQAKVIRRTTEIITIQSTQDVYKKPMDHNMREMDKEVESRSA
jgi:hypothetical protein